MARPRLKSYQSRVEDGQIILNREFGVQATLPDPDGQVMALLKLLDGTREVDEAAAAMIRRWPALTAPEVIEGIRSLEEAGLLEDGAAPTGLTARQQERYFSNLAFFGTFASLDRSRFQFQERLAHARVVLLGVGGLGSTVLQHLAGLGVGHVTVLDSDRVEWKNLARQFLYSEAEVGMSKLERAVQRARALNSEMEITPVERRVRGPADVAPLLPGADLVVCGIDTPAEVYDWVNEACVCAGVPYIAGGMQVGRGLYYAVSPGRSGCRACLHRHRGPEREAEPLGPAERVNRGIGPVAGLMGSLVSLEAVRFLTGFAPPVAAGRLWLVDLATGETGVGYEWPRMPVCPVCAGGWTT